MQSTNHTLSLSIASDYALIWLLQLLFNYLIVDHTADAFTTPDSKASNQSITDNVINILFSGFSRWDSQHFLHIALKGYILYRLTKEIFDDLQICRLCVLLYSNVFANILSSRFWVGKSCPLAAAERPAYLLDYAKQRGYRYKCELDNLQWCRKPLPLSYSAVQSYYWDVGFLRYYQWRKIPCFILTIPVLILVYKSVYCNAQHFAFYEKVKWIFSIHIICLSILGLLFFNVEILTRMLFSASPFLYWQAALILADNFSKVSSRKRMHFYGTFMVDDICQLWKGSNFRGRLNSPCSCSVVVITSASHAEGPWFEPRQEQKICHFLLLYFYAIYLNSDTVCHNALFKADNVEADCHHYLGA
ncbi:GPI mannosyltransferase 2 [Trichinella spiralis]|uniref:GPI mannosyltransferase 2 n=1 Tax=Trichinella spiralis TaxID=6334 RepID=A0A0V1B6B8_TRISP|nr:GPI mannosyltransferase 2 [Trichinella spiralis]